jgi:hypothetical protein
VITLQKRQCSAHAFFFCGRLPASVAYSPDLASSDYHSLSKLKEFLGGRRFKRDEEVKDAVKEWLNGLAAEVYDEGIQKLVTRYDKCLNVGSDYAEK